MNNSETNIIFFGTDQDVSVTVLQKMKEGNMTPSLIVTQPDRPQGRKLVLAPSPVKVWATENNIETITPEKLDDASVAALRAATADFFVVASYGLIIPQAVLDIPKYATLNVHPSLLPKYRGATPLESAMLDDEKNTGVTIIEMDHKMDHGPIVATHAHSFEEWPTKPEVARLLSSFGGELIIESILKYIDGTVEKAEQDHESATFTKKIVKADGELDIIDGNLRSNFLKTQAYTPWPGTFFFKDGKRIKISEAVWENNSFVIKKVIPEGKKEVEYTIWCNQ